ncbi:MAG: DoxX family protein [Candidatus Dadabacteria bacterium]|jgi:putative oxidoreductase|nr:DoxX family protein [Candidatus Dadabacteria bacterium]
MLSSLLHTNDDIGLFIARISLGIVILPHGLQKLLGLFGGPGFSGTVDFFVGSGLPSAVAILIIIAESFGALGLILGFLSRLAAFGITLIMLGAIFMVHIQNGFFMNWFGNQAGEGFEYHLLALGLSLVVLIKGGGKWSIDKMIVN